MMAGMTITSNAPPIPANAVPASVTGHAGPRQSMVIPAADRRSRHEQRLPATEPIDDANPANAGEQRGKPERRAVHRRNHAGKVELLAQLAEHGADAEAADQQGVAECRGVGESIPPELAGDQMGSNSHPLLYQ